MRPIESTTVPSSTYAPTCDASPAEVADAQRALNFIAGEDTLREDGRLDAATQAAVRAFQREHRLPETGCLDERTQTVLLEAAAEHEPASHCPEGPRTQTRTRGAEARPQLNEMEIRAMAIASTVGRGGVSSYAHASSSFATPQEAARAFDAQAARLFDVHNWSELSDALGADFELFNPQGDATDRPARVGDFVRIDLPGPQPYHWVRIESASLTEGRAQIVVRPSHDPTSTDPATAHFFNSAATNTFSVTRSGSTVTCEVRGRNEFVNMGTSAADALLNRATAEGAWGVGGAGMQRHQWNVFTERLSQTRP